MKKHTLTEILDIDAARSFSEEQREALWQELSALLPCPEKGPCEAAPVRAARKGPGAYFFGVLTAVLLLCIGFAAAAQLWGGELVLQEEEPPPLSVWTEDPAAPGGP